MTDEQIKHMVERFLTWRLPEDFNPDGGVTFKPTFNENTDHPMKNEPVGTNLLTYTQAEKMVRHMIESLPECSLEVSTKGDDRMKFKFNFSAVDAKGVAFVMQANVTIDPQSVGLTELSSKGAMEVVICRLQESLGIKIDSINNEI